MGASTSKGWKAGEGVVLPGFPDAFNKVNRNAPNSRAFVNMIGKIADQGFVRASFWQRRGYLEVDRESIRARLTNH